MKYLIESEGKLYGYDDAAILLIHIAENKQFPDRVFKRDEGGIVISYSQIKLNDLKGENNV